MKYSVLTTLAAAALLMGCIRLPDDGGGNPSTDSHFKLEFSPVRTVSLDPWSTASAAPTTVRIEGAGDIQQFWANAQGPASIPLQRGNLSLSYAFSSDNGCQALAQQAQQEGRTLEVEGFGTVAELEPMYACPAIACLPPDPQSGSATPTSYPCGCQAPPISFLVRADKLISCSLGGNVILPPQAD